MFGYKLVKVENLKKAMTSIRNCADSFQKIEEKTEVLDLSEEVKKQLWIDEVFGLSCVINAEMNLAGLGDFDLKGFLEDYKRKS